MRGKGGERGLGTPPGRSGGEGMLGSGRALGDGLLYSLSPGADPALSLQFDFTSCQGVLFVLLMTLFFSGLILAVLLPFQYVSLGESQGAPWGRRRACWPEGAISSHTLQGRPRAKGSQPAILSSPSWHLPWAYWQCKQTNKEAFLSRPGHLPAPRATSGFTFPILPLVGRGVCHGAFKPLAQGSSGAPWGHQAQRGPEEGPPGALGESAKSRGADSRQPGR